MAAYTNTNQLYQQSERVRPKLEEWLNKFQTPANLIPKRDVQLLSERDFRVPAITDEPGREGTYNPNGGEIGRGQSTKGQVMISTFYPLRQAFELTQLEVEATQSGEQAAKSVFKDVMKRALPGFAAFRNRLFFTDGTPTLGTATAQATVSGVTVYTMDSTFGTRRLRRGQYVAIYDSTLTTLRTTERITSINYKDRKVTLASTISGAASTDVLCFEGVSGASPTGIQGLYYWNSSAQTGTTAGINRANEPEIWSNSVSGSGGLASIIGLNLFHQMVERRGVESLSGLLGISGLSQHAAAVANVMNVQNILNINGQTAEMKDLLPAVALAFPFAGVKHMVVPMQDATRLDWISPQETWGVARLHDTKYFEIGGSRFFPTYGSGGSPNAAMWFALVCNENFFCANPGGNGVITSLPVEAPYA